MQLSYYFTDKKLTKFIITNEADNYEYICDFYDYGTTTIPVKVDGNINENGNDSNDSNDIFYTASYPQDFEYNGRHYHLVQGVGLKTTVTQEELGELLGYIIREEDFKVTHIPSRLSTRLLGLEEKISPKIQIEEQECVCEANNPYYYKNMVLTINFPLHTRQAEFEIDANIFVEQIETDNIYDFIMWINEEKQDFELFDTNIINGDIIKIKISRDDDLKESKITIIGHDKNIVIDENYNPESSMDEYITEENINFKNEKLK